MAVSATLSDMNPPATENPFPRAAQFLLIGVALIESLGGLESFAVLLAGDPEVPGPGLGGLAVKTYLALRPLLAPAALVFAATGRPRLAIAALAGILALAWLNMLPSFVLHGFDVEGVAIANTMGFILYPLLAIAGAMLAVRDRNLVLAAALVSLPTLAGIIGVAAFAVGVMLYGF